ncbi:MAG: NAD(P)H-dependent flavin oxidoreductase [Bacillota bacterium]
MKLPELIIGKLKPKIPIIQGGMAVRVSTAPLVAAVANQGGIGLIGGSGMDPSELRQEISKARDMSEGIIGVNIMVAVREFKELVNAAVTEGIDLIVAGAGFSRDIFSIGREHDVEIVPIVSSLKLAKISEKLGASAIVVEGKEAGGHLGTDKPLKHLLHKIVGKVSLPIIAAGGIIDGKDISEMFELGVQGVQMGSRFVASQECEVADSFKNKYIEATEEDGQLIDSPVGLKGRALTTNFLERLEKGEITTGDTCDYLCLKKCDKSFCIMKALIEAHDGDLNNGLVFAGEKAHLINKVLSVKDIINNLLAEIKDY